MILQSLYRYYEILCEDPEVGVAEPGYSNAPVNHALNLSLIHISEPTRPY